MEFKSILEKRRSVRKYIERPVEDEVVERLVAATLTAPSSRNARSTQLIVVRDRALIARMGEMRDYGSAFMSAAPLVIVVAGDSAKTDLWQVNAAISATVLHLACVNEGLASCWVHIDARPRLKDAPQGETAADYLRTFLPIPEGCEPLCALAIGYSDFTPAPLPESNDAERVIWVK